MERLEADLLELTDVVDRNVGEIWFAYMAPLITKEQLPNELIRLEQRGWVSKTTKDRWLITEAGRTALSDARNWTIAVRSVTQAPASDRHYLVAGALTAGSGCFLDKYWPPFLVIRNGHEGGHGRLLSRVESDPEPGDESLRLEVESDPIRLVTF